MVLKLIDSYLDERFFFPPLKKHVTVTPKTLNAILKSRSRMSELGSFCNEARGPVLCCAVICCTRERTTCVPLATLAAVEGRLGDLVTISCRLKLRPWSRLLAEGATQGSKTHTHTHIQGLTLSSVTGRNGGRKVGHTTVSSHPHHNTSAQGSKSFI